MRPLRPEPIIIRRCTRKGKWIKGCKFESRYNLGPSTITVEQITALRLPNAATEVPIPLGNIVDQFRPRAYVCDICTRCGKRVERA